ncbi:MAG: hypothetical protein IPJ65_02170 [Archangiaceae bacterium]|nr:hypothetical protein [Archangiaceae bacterium]
MQAMLVDPSGLGVGRGVDFGELREHVAARRLVSELPEGDRLLLNTEGDGELGQRPGAARTGGRPDAGACGCFDETCLKGRAGFPWRALSCWPIALLHGGLGACKHKVLAIVEEEGAARASYALKLLQSEGELTIASTGKEPASGKLVTHEYESWKGRPSSSSPLQRLKSTRSCSTAVWC